MCRQCQVNQSDHQRHIHWLHRQIINYHRRVQIMRPTWQHQQTLFPMETIHRWYVKHPNHFKRAPTCCMLIRQIQSQYRKYMYCYCKSIFYRYIHSFSYSLIQTIFRIQQYVFETLSIRFGIAEIEKVFSWYVYKDKCRWTIFSIAEKKKKEAAVKCRNRV